MMGVVILNSYYVFCNKKVQVLVVFPNIFNTHTHDKFVIILNWTYVYILDGRWPQD
jgi:hypothetical protein